QRNRRARARPAESSRCRHALAGIPWWRRPGTRHADAETDTLASATWPSPATAVGTAGRRLCRVLARGGARRAMAATRSGSSLGRAPGCPGGQADSEQRTYAGGLAEQRRLTEQPHAQCTESQRRRDRQQRPMAEAAVGEVHQVANGRERATEPVLMEQQVDQPGPVQVPDRSVGREHKALGAAPG